MWDNDFCNAVIDASLYWTGDDEANCPALKYLRTMAGYYLWENAGRPFPRTPITIFFPTVKDRRSEMQKNISKLKELSQTVVDLCLEEYNMPSFPVVVKRVQRGRCNKKSITIPAKIATGHHEAYQIYYAVHEATHLIRGSGHGPVFKKTEDDLLKKFGIKIKRAKAYPKDIWYDGEKIVDNDTYTLQGKMAIEGVK